MGIVLAFLVGYAVGARAGQQGYDELVTSMRAVRDSSEFQGFVAALRSHAGATLQDLSFKVADDRDARLTLQDVLQGARRWIAEGPTAGASRGSGPDPGVR